MCFILMYCVLNTLSEYTYFYISKNITSYTFVACFQNLQKCSVYPWWNKIISGKRNSTKMSFLKTQLQISKTRCVDTYCSCNRASQFSASQDIHCTNYLEKPTNNEKYINKRDRLFIHQTMCVSKLTCQGEKISFVVAIRTSFTRKTFLYKSVKGHTSSSAYVAAV